MISRRQFLVAGVAVVVAGCSSDNASSTTGATTATSVTDASTDTAASTTTVPPSTSAGSITTSSSTSTASPPTSAATSTAAPTTTVDPAALAQAYSGAGQHPVGVTTLTLPAGNKVEVWYPAVAGSTGIETYDVRDFTPEAIRAILTADVPATHSYAAARDADPAAESFPLVLFSHGYTGIRMQSTFLTAHLASWGMVVAAPDHPSRDMLHVLGNDPATSDPVAELLGCIDLVTADARLGAHVDAQHIGAVGHSAGGGTVLGAAHDPRVNGYVSMASGAFASDARAGPAPLPDRPSFFLAGSVDGVVPVGTVTRPTFVDAPTPSLLWVIDGVGHNGFDDFCTFGNGTGIIGVAQASGLGPVLDAQPQLRKLGEDGCVSPAVPVDTTFPIINHAVTAWLRHVFGVDPDPVGLGPNVAGSYVQRVEIDQH